MARIGEFAVANEGYYGVSLNYVFLGYLIKFIEMKQIIIFLLLIIVGILGYNFYKNYKRFNPPNYQYQIPEEISSNPSESGLLYDYYQAVEELDGYVITQWSTEGVDVRNPGKDGSEVTASIANYAKKKAKVRFYEKQLLQPNKVEEKAKGSSEAEKRKQLVSKLFYVNPNSNSLRLGEKSALVFEIQQLLIENGDSIKRDGLFRAETFTALKNFEEKNGLFPDGKLDVITLQYLLK